MHVPQGRHTASQPPVRRPVATRNKAFATHNEGTGDAGHRAAGPVGRNRPRERPATGVLTGFLIRQTAQCIPLENPEGISHLRAARPYTAQPF